MAKRGRPFKSEIRQNIIDILEFLGKGYGYEIYKVYVSIFPKVTMRSVYYHLRKGTDLEEISLNEIKEESGNFSWGDSVEKSYYTIGKNGRPRHNDLVKQFFESRKE